MLANVGTQYGFHFSYVILKHLLFVESLGCHSLLQLAFYWLYLDVPSKNFKPIKGRNLLIFSNFFAIYIIIVLQRA